MPDPRRWPRLSALLLLTAALGAGAACSGSPNPKSAQKAKANSDDAMLAFARCMREHGIDMPDPDTAGAGGAVTIGGGPGSDQSKLDTEMQKFTDADKACRDQLGDAAPQKPSPKQQQEMQDQALAFSRCMREHGVDMPDPNFDGEGHVSMKIDGASGLDPSDPKFEAAQQACGSAFGPKGGKGGPGGFSVNSKSAGAKDGSGPQGGAVFFGGGGAATAGNGGGK